MKKRGQQPDAHTFTIIIRGCTEHKDLPAAMGKVMTIFTAMSTERSLVKPNAIHLNAVIKMCARAGNMDTMYGFLAQMPKKGPGAPNNVTYTTVLNAVRTNTLIDLRGRYTAVQKRDNTRKAILEARRMWQDITNRWRKGDLWIDEELVCAMGRLLTFGDEFDIDDVLSLIEQTMNIPRQTKKLNNDSRSDTEAFLPADVAVPSMAPEVAIATTSNADEETEESIIAAMKRAHYDSFASISPPNAPMPSTSAYAKPSNSTLMLLMEVFVRMSLKQPAWKYWNLITKEFGVEPDMASCHGYLRVLRVCRSSTETVEFLQHIKGKEVRPATFRIAIAACIRDKNNRNAFANAGKILDIMTDTLQIVDIPVLQTYLEVGVGCISHLSQLERGKQILRALERLGPSFINIKSLLTFGPSNQTELTSLELKEYQDQVLHLVRTMTGAYDVLMNRGYVARDNYSKYTAERSKLAAFAQRRDDWAQKDPTQEFKLSPEQKEYVRKHHLNKAMVRSRGSTQRWQEFVEETRRGMERDLIKAAEAKALKDPEAEAEEAKKAAEDDKKFADIMATQMKIRR
jgi:pentatricopeptide repeat protein